jgi:hypothetical protein
MKTLFKTFWPCFFLAAALPLVRATEATNIIAMGPWSEPTACSGEDISCGPIRARLLVCYGFSPLAAGRPANLPETQVYLELQNLGNRPLELYADFKNGLKAELLDIDGRPPRLSGGPGSGSFPPASWVSLPYDASIRLRASWYGFGMPRNNGLAIPLFHPLTIRPGDTNEYFLSGTFTVTPPTNHVAPLESRVWQGRVILPKMKISAVRK